MFKYSIKLNDYKRTSNKYNYDYGNTKDIKVKIGRDKALVEFVMTRHYNKEDFVNLSCGVFEDAYRKIYLAHVFLFGKTFKLKMIKVSIKKGGNIEQFAIEKELMSSLLRNKFNYRLLKTEKLIEKIMHQSKSEINKDKCFCSLQSYLFGREKDSEIDKFANYWTSMNAIYSYCSILFANEIIRLKGTDAIKNINPVNMEEPSIFIALYLLNENNKLKKGFTGSREMQIKIRTQIIQLFERSLKDIQEDDFATIYSLAENDKIGDYKNELFNQINQSLKDNGVNFFGFLLYLYPYHYRCNFVHGSLSLPIVCSNNDYILHSLRFMNYCMNRYLENEIPKIFSDDMFINEDKALIICDLLKKREHEKN